MCIWVPSRWLYAAEVPIYTLLQFALLSAEELLIGQFVR